MPEDGTRSVHDATAFLDAAGAVFESLGRAVFYLDGDFRIVYSAVNELVDANGHPPRDALRGSSAADAFGEELFGEHGALRRALAAGERREGWGATVHADGSAARWVSLSCAPLRFAPDPRIAYVVVVRPEDEPLDRDAPAPTVYAGLIARSPAMLRVFRLIDHLCESDATVLITGESGTGKELVARALAQHSPRARKPFVAVNCAALPGSLLESELFGHVRGAFTGAVRDREGRFEVADGGTLFLDEIGDVPLPLQAKLLRVLQERAYERVGDSRPRKADVRVIAATNRDLKRAIHDGSFRDDLFYRLCVVPIELPPLRARREDIEPLARFLLGRIGSRQSRARRMGPDASRAILNYDWPGNVRELENALEFAVAVGRGQTIHIQDLPREITHGARHAESVPTLAHSSRQDAPPSRHEERDRIRRILEESRWNRNVAARELGMSRTTLWRKMREYGLISR